MAGRDTYSLEEIKVLWDGYKRVSGIGILKDGRWQYHFNKKMDLSHIPGHKASVVKLMDVMEFPEFLEKYDNS